jgi:hypothetical protein
MTDVESAELAAKEATANKARAEAEAASDVLAIEGDAQFNKVVGGVEVALVEFYAPVMLEDRLPRGRCFACS